MSSSSQASISFGHNDTVFNAISAHPNGYGEILTTDFSLSMGLAVKFGGTVCDSLENQNPEVFPPYPWS
ncbi:hypothetical protein [Desulfatitalea tepidiphila]|uniref:hypothetical protein n=1 Tax=Desulfatitalea tepidiphila TaxID=1185843 RepID=UPI00128E9B04|nr:hypothetical protein [Desulfatitalea tepidiphila]